ncbi:MAG: hypothetical protein S4CHLAM7_04860 [Chlamydiae bacterium]|nr:hypothetical protein [Chlamydiota bacterium]
MAKNKLVYPLEQVLDIKKRRVKAAEKVVQEKQRVLESEKKKLKGYQEAYKKVDDHHQDKLDQLRAGLDEGIQLHEIDQMKQYLKEVKLKRIEEQRKVDRQKKQVEMAQKKLDEAKKILKEKRLEVDKLKTHKSDWVTQELNEIRRQEAKQLDEVGSLVHLSNKRREKNEETKKKGRYKNG